MTQDVGERFEIDPKYEYGIWVSFIEVYNEQLFDLLDISARTTKKRNQLHLKYEQRSGCKYVSDANMVKVKTMEVITKARFFIYMPCNNPFTLMIGSRCHHATRPTK